MKKAIPSLFLALLSAGACAGMQAADASVGACLPQPCTVLICVAGLAFVRLTAGRLS